MLGWSVEEADEEEEEAGGDFALVEAAARLVVAVVVAVVDLLLVDMMNLGREVVAVVGRYGEEASGRVDRAERSWRGDGMMGIDGRVVWRKIIESREVHTYMYLPNSHVCMYGVQSYECTNVELATYLTNYIGLNTKYKLTMPKSVVRQASLYVTIYIFSYI